MSTDSRLTDSHDRPNGSHSPGEPASFESRAAPRRRASRRSRAAEDASKRTISDAASAAVAHGTEAGDYFGTLVTVRKDKTGLAIRRGITRAGIGLALACVAGTCLITATLLVIQGLANGLAVLFGGRAWLGDLVAGALLFTVVAVGVSVLRARHNRIRMAKQEQKYEQLRNEHRARHGRHIADAIAPLDRGGAPGPGGTPGVRGTAAQPQ